MKKKLVKKGFTNFQTSCTPEFLQRLTDYCYKTAINRSALVRKLLEKEISEKELKS